MIGKLSPAPACVLWAEAGGVPCHRVTPVSRSHRPSIGVTDVASHINKSAYDGETMNRKIRGISIREKLNILENSTGIFFLIIFRAKDDNCCIILLSSLHSHSVLIPESYCISNFKQY